MPFSASDFYIMNFSIYHVRFHIIGVHSWIDPATGIMLNNSTEVAD